jgi:protein-S-isoprenylcysteine O-methyltransferase Ste14
MQYILLTILWILWCTIHSLLISLLVTTYLEIKLGIQYRFYRLFYNFISIVTLIPILLYSHRVQGALIYTWEGNLIIIQFILFMFAFILFLTGARKYDIMQFLGIRQIQSGRSHAPLTDSDKIDMTGVLGVTRHPWYLGAIILIWVFNKDIYLSTLIINIILTIYLIVGTYLEERKLLAICGERYRNYQEKVSMLLPIKWVKVKLNLK